MISSYLGVKAQNIVFLLGVAILLFPGQMGLSKTYFNYAIQTGQMLCGRYEYLSEPIFLVLMVVAGEIVGLLQDVPCDTLGDGAVILGPLLLTFAGCLLLAYVIRPMGVYALMFIAFIVLDGATRTLPFHLLRQFLSFTVFIIAFYFVLSHRWRDTALLWASFLAALVHFSAWLLVFITVLAFFVSKFSATRQSLRVLVSENFWPKVGVTTALLLLLVISPIPGYLLTKMQGHLSYPFSALIQTIGDGSGLVFFAKQLIVLGALFFLSIRGKSVFCASFFVICAVVWFAVLAVGFDSVVFNRVQLIIMPLAYFAFLVALSQKELSTRSEFWNAVFLILVVGSYFYDAKVARFIEPSGVVSLSFFD